METNKATATYSYSQKEHMGMVSMCESLKPLEWWYMNMKKKWLNAAEIRSPYGWLQIFRNRHEIMLNEVCGAAGDVFEENIADWFAKY